MTDTAIDIAPQGFKQQSQIGKSTEIRRIQLDRFSIMLLRFVAAIQRGEQQAEIGKGGRGIRIQLNRFSVTTLGVACMFVA